MKLLSHTYFLLVKDIRSEIKNKHLLAGLALYVFSSCYLIYRFLEEENATDQLEIKYWKIFFWLIVLFASMNAMTRSFTVESGKQHLYYLNLCSAEAIILGKQLYNMIMVCGLSSLAVALLIVYLGNPIHQLLPFILSVLLGAGGFSILLTFIAAISAKTGNNISMLAFLGFPLVIPLIGFCLALSNQAFVGIEDTNFWSNVLIMFAFDGVIFALSLLLFPYIWRD